MVELKPELFVDSGANYEEGRLRHDVLCDFKVEEWVKDGLRDDTIYFVDKEYYHTPSNVDPEIASKVGAGPEGRGWAGDLDAGKLHVPTGELTKIELKSPGRIPSREEREQSEETFNPIRKAEKQNKYMKRLLDNIEANTGISVPYSPQVEAWNDVVNEPIILDDLPYYSENGGYMCTEEAYERAKGSEMVELIDENLFKGRMFGGGEDLLEEV
ncbi:MAG: hypothetical protein H8Z69_02110 [Nanohaloarchaea archaeon]|nr:hypothetical protein [Candidatus Nanohaloarchaea archaeon]